MIIELFDQGRIVEICYHNSKTLTKINYLNNGQVILKEHRRDGQYHYDLGPALVEYYGSGYLAIIKYCHNGKFHREERVGPALAWWYLNGRPYLKEYRCEEKHHRDIGPAFEKWYDNGLPWEKVYIQHNKRHRPYEFGPALESWYKNGILRCREYAQNGKRYRDPQLGPAKEKWYDNGQVESIKYSRHNSHLQ